MTELANGRTAKRRQPTLMRTGMDQDDVDAYVKRLNRFIAVLSRVDPAMSAEGIRLLHPSLQHFDVRLRERGLRFHADVNDHWRAWGITDERVPADEAPVDAGGLLKLMRTWKRDLSVPIFRVWGGRRTEHDEIHVHARSIARLAAALIPEAAHAWLTVHPPTARAPGRIVLKTDRKWCFDPVLEERLLKDVPVCVLISQSDLYNDISFVEEDDGVAAHVPHDLDPMERLRLLASVADVKRPLRRL